MVQSNVSRASDVLTTHAATDINYQTHQPTPSHDHARDALRLALGSILAPKRYTPNPGVRSTSSSGTASPAPQTQSPHPGSHLSFPHPHSHPHSHSLQHQPHVHSHLVPGREHAHSSLSTSSSTSHSPHSSSPATPITEIGSNGVSSPNPFNHYPRPGMLSRSISASSSHSIRPTPSSSVSAPTVSGHANAGSASVGADSALHQTQNGNGNGNSGGAGIELDSERIHAPQLQSDSRPSLDGIPAAPHSSSSIPVVAVTTPGGTPIPGKNKFIQTLEGKTHSAWEALIHGSFS